MSAAIATMGSGGQVLPLAPNFLGGRDVPLGVHVLLIGFKMAAFAGFIPSAPIIIPKSEQMVAGARPAAAEVSRVADAGEMVEHLRGLGLPVSAIADVLDVERKTVYSWTEGGVPNTANAERLAQLFDLLRAEPEGSLRYLHRFWERSLPGGGTLRAILLASEIDIAAAKAAVAALRPAVLRAMRAAKPTLVLSSSQDSPASHLTLHLTADSQR